MAFEPSMDLDSRKKQKELRQKKDGGQTKYGFSISKEVGYLRQEIMGVSMKYIFFFSNP